MTEPAGAGVPGYPVQFAVAYPDRDLNRVTTFFRIFVAIPILIVLAAVDGGNSYSHVGHYAWSFSAGAGGTLVFAPLVMILFREKYPRWWFDWNQQLMRFSARVAVFLALMDDTYPSTDEEQAVRLDFAYPDVQENLNRWLPLVKWLLAIPHFIILFFLSIAAFVCVVIAWVAILFTGRYPRGLFDFVEGVFRWWTRVIGYALVLVTDEYPPFSLSA
jgi:hypothetical protein